MESNSYNTDNTEPKEYSASSSEQSITLEEAREAYVQKNYILFEESFDRFDKAGGFQFTFCWPVFFAGILWFLYRKMYIESIGIFLLNMIGGGVLLVIGPEDGSGPLAFGVCLAVVLSFSGRWFYWKAVDRQVEKAWDLHAGNPRAALDWLRAKGGVNVWIVAAVLGGVLMYMFSVAGQL
ncbi:hypothetical protein C4J81_11430 [Deltaproteobacteria bacterium Smac51]|nr:hypothetical protein C4J81_11430 [Deltaproteobacteria bacterium Smac51]